MLAPGAMGKEGGVLGTVGGTAVAELQGPQAVDSQRSSRARVELAALLRLAPPLGLREIEGVDLAVAEVADQQITREESEAGGCLGQTPRGVQAAARGNAAEEAAGRIGGNDEAAAPPGHVIVREGILQPVRHG